MVFGAAVACGAVTPLGGVQSFHWGRSLVCYVINFAPHEALSVRQVDVWWKGRAPPCRWSAQIGPHRFVLCMIRLSDILLIVISFRVLARGVFGATRHSDGGVSQTLIPAISGSAVVRVWHIHDSQGHIQWVWHIYDSQDHFQALVKAIFRPWLSRKSPWNPSVVPSSLGSGGCTEGSSQVHSYLTECIHQLVLVSQLPHKIDNLLFTITNWNIEQTVFGGSWLSKTD